MPGSAGAAGCQRGCVCHCSPFLSRRSALPLRARSRPSTSRARSVAPSMHAPWSPCLAKACSSSCPSPSLAAFCPPRPRALPHVRQTLEVGAPMATPAATPSKVRMHLCLRVYKCVCVCARTSCACTCVCADAKLATDGQHNLACPCSNLLFSVSCLFSRPFSFSRALCLSLSLFLSLSLSLFLSFFLSLSLSLVLFLRSRPADRALQTRRL